MVVEASFAETARHRNWKILALNVRSQHLHVVLTSISGFTPERVMNDLKVYATRALRRERLLRSDARFWSRHGSTGWLWTEADIEAAIIYTRDRQGADLAGSRWSELTDAVAGDGIAGFDGPALADAHASDGSG